MAAAYPPAVLTLGLRNYLDKICQPSLLKLSKI